MAWITRSLGLTLKVPADGTKNWGSQFITDFVDKISAHDHSGGGKGLTVTLADGSVTTVKLNINADLNMNNYKLTSLGVLAQNLSFTTASKKTIKLAEGQTAVTAAGTDQASATAIDSVINVVTAGTGGVRLPQATTWEIGKLMIVAQLTAGSLNVYPATGQYFVGKATNDPLIIQAASDFEPCLLLVPIGPTYWAWFSSKGGL